MLVVLYLSMCMTGGNNCTVGNENDLLGLLFRGWVGGETSNKKAGLE